MIIFPAKNQIVARNVFSYSPVGVSNNPTAAYPDITGFRYVAVSGVTSQQVGSHGQTINISGNTVTINYASHPGNVVTGYIMTMGTRPASVYGFALTAIVNAGDPTQEGRIGDPGGAGSPANDMQTGGSVLIGELSTSETYLYHIGNVSPAEAIYNVRLSFDGESGVFIGNDATKNQIFFGPEVAGGFAGDTVEIVFSEIYWIQEI